VVGGDAEASEFAAHHLAMNLDLRILRGIGSDAEAVAIVVAEDDVDGRGESAAQLMDDEGRAEVAAANERVGAARGVERPANFHTLS
jgi:hypothetical protein